jgi:succinate dehydrogenase/fumarate reductase flavoprotein subunit
MSFTSIHCDVLVVGGGAAGVAAASAAGRAGARVVLLERYGFLGGLATAAQVGTICGLYLRAPKPCRSPRVLRRNSLRNCSKSPD